MALGTPESGMSISDLPSSSVETSPSSATSFESIASSMDNSMSPEPSIDASLFGTQPDNLPTHDDHADEPLLSPSDNVSQNMSDQEPPLIDNAPSKINEDEQIYEESTELLTEPQQTEDSNDIQPNTEEMLKKAYGVSLSAAKAYAEHAHEVGKMSDKLFNYLQQLPEEDLVKQVARFYPQESGLQQALKKQDEIQAKILEVQADEQKRRESEEKDLAQQQLERQEKEQKGKMALLTGIYADKLGIPEDKLDMGVMEAVAKKIAENMDLNSMSYDQVKEKMVHLCEEDEEFRNYAVETYKKQLYQKAYDNKAAELRSTGLYPEDYIHDLADQHAQKVVKLFEEKSQESQQSQSELKQFIAEELGGVLHLFMEVFVPQILQEMKGSKQ